MQVAWRDEGTSAGKSRLDACRSIALQAPRRSTSCHCTNKPRPNYQHKKYNSKLERYICTTRK